MRKSCFVHKYHHQCPSQDPLNQYPGYLTYAASNPYHPLVNQSVIDRATANWSAPDNGCQARV